MEMNVASSLACYDICVQLMRSNRVSYRQLCGLGQLAHVDDLGSQGIWDKLSQVLSKHLDAVVHLQLSFWSLFW